MVTLLSAIQQVAERLGQSKPASVIGSSDKQTVQWRAILEEGLEQLVNRGQWQQLTREATWVTTATEDQGELADLATDGFSYMLPQTLWDRTNIRPLVGPLDNQDWQALKAWVVQGPHHQFRVRGDHLLVNPTPAADLTWAFEYQSENFIQPDPGVGGANKKLFTADTDLILLPETIVKLDLRWRWKKEKGLSYAQDFDDCEALVVNALARAKPRQVLHLDSGLEDSGPRVGIPVGSWNL